MFGQLMKGNGVSLELGAILLHLVVLEVDLKGVPKSDICFCDVQLSTFACNQGRPGTLVSLVLG